MATVETVPLEAEERNETMTLMSSLRLEVEGQLKVLNT